MSGLTVAFALRSAMELVRALLTNKRVCYRFATVQAATGNVRLLLVTAKGQLGSSRQPTEVGLQVVFE